jgi:hypothetical protein
MIAMKADDVIDKVERMSKLYLPHAGPCLLNGRMLPLEATCIPPLQTLGCRAPLSVALIRVPLQ